MVVPRFLYVMARRVLELALLRFRSQSYQELEIVVLRHELAILRLWGANIRIGLLHAVVGA